MRRGARPLSRRPRMAEFGVGNQLSVVDDGRPDAGPEGQQDHQAGLVGARAVALLGQARRVRVVEDRDVLAVQLRADDVACVGADPGLVDVGRGLHHAMGDDAGVGDPEWAGPVERLDDLGDGLGHRGRGGRLRVSSLTRSPINCPVSRSTILPLMPLPPTSTPNARRAALSSGAVPDERSAPGSVLVIASPRRESGVRSP